VVQGLPALGAEAADFWKLVLTGRTAFHDPHSPFTHA